MNWATTESAWARITLLFMAAALVASGAAMWSGTQNALAAKGFMPHGVCYVWNPSLIGLHLVSDTLIGLAYFSIPITLIYFILKRRDLPFNWMFLLFGLFIVACGTTHWMEVWTLWEPQYWLAGVIKAITAAASVPTAIALVLLIPQALAIPSAHQALGSDLLRRRISWPHDARDGPHRKGRSLQGRLRPVSGGDLSCAFSDRLPRRQRCCVPGSAR